MSDSAELKHLTSLNIRLDFTFKLDSTQLHLDISQLEMQPLTVFIGPNSSGKSVTAKIISALMNVEPEVFTLENRWIIYITPGRRLSKAWSSPVNEYQGILEVSTELFNIRFRVESGHFGLIIDNVDISEQLAKTLETKLADWDFSLKDLCSLSERVRELENLRGEGIEQVACVLDRLVRLVCAVSIHVPDYRQHLLYSISERLILHDPIRTARLIANMLTNIRKLLELSRDYSQEKPYVYEDLRKFVEEECEAMLRDVYGVDDVETSDILPLTFNFELPWITDDRLLADYVSWGLLRYDSARRPFDVYTKLVGGGSIDKAPSGIATAFVIEMLIHAYLAARKVPILLVVEEPELHTHPLQAVALGMLMAWFIDRNMREVQEGRAKPLRILVTTHSPELVRGCLYTEHVAINIFKRRGTTMTAQVWDGKSRVFGFDEAALLAIRQSRRGIEAIRKRHEKREERQ